MNEKEYIKAPIEVKSAHKTDDGLIDTIEIRAAVFGNIDDQDDVIRRGAFQKSLRNRVPRNIVKFVDNHNYEIKSTYGTVINGRESDEGLDVEVKFSKTPDAQQAAQKIAERHINQFSIGYIAREQEKGKKNGKRVRFLDDVELKEVTGTAVAINDQTEVLSVNQKSAKNLLDKLDEQGVVDKKAFPSSAPFEDFTGCVTWASDHDAVEDAASWCSLLRAGQATYPPKKSAEANPELEGKPMPSDAPFDTFDECITWANQNENIDDAESFCGAVESEGQFPPKKKGDPAENALVELMQRSIGSLQSGKVQEEELTEEKAGLLRSAIVEILRQHLDEGLNIDFRTVAEAIMRAIAASSKSVDPEEIETEVDEAEMKSLRQEIINRRIDLQDSKLNGK